MKSGKYLKQRARPDVGAAWRWPIFARRVVGRSMMPALPPGTIVVGLRWFRSLEPGDIIVFEHEYMEKIKRIAKKTKSGGLRVAGEQAEASRDSRHFGTISRSSVLGKVVWPTPGFCLQLARRVCYHKRNRSTNQQ